MTTRHKYGDARPDGFRFNGYARLKPDGSGRYESWLSPESFEKQRLARLFNNRGYHSNNRERMAARKRDWNRRNPEAAKAIDCRSKLKNREKLLARRKRYEVENKAKIREYRKLRNSEPRFNIISRIRRRVNHFLAPRGIKKPTTTLNMLGCSREALRRHIEKQFLPGMSWNNRFLWHIDHEIPFHAIDPQSETQLRMVCHFTNLRPLWAKDNMTRPRSEKLTSV